MGLRIRQTPSRKVRIITTIIAAFALVTQPMYGLFSVAVANAISDTAYSTQPLSGWSPDRQTPSGGYGVEPFAGRDSIKLGVDSSHVNTSGNGFYKTEGVKRTTSVASDTIKGDLYVDSSWKTAGKTIRAGLWGVGRDSSNAVSAYPIVEFANYGGYVGWRLWDSAGLGGWVNLPGVAFKTNKWNALELALSKTDNTKVDVYINGVLVGQSTVEPTVSFNEIILNSYNSGTTDYTVYWSKVTAGRYRLAAPSLVAPADGAYLNDTASTAKWDAVTGATKYIYESYSDAAATQRRVHKTTASTQWTETNLTDGSLFWRVRAVDVRGVIGVWSELHKVVVDTTVPSVPTGGQPNGATQPTNVFDFTWNSSADTNPVTYEYQSTQNPAETDDILTTSLWKSGVLPTPMIHSSGAGDGVWYWQVRAIDAAGNKSDWSEVWNMRIDSQGPSLNATNPSEGQLFGGTSSTATVEATASDPSGLGAYYVALDGVGKKYVFHPANGAMETVTIDLSGVSEGGHTILVRVTDLLGHATEIKRHITIDKTAPTTMLSNPFAGQVVGGSTLELKGTVTDQNGISEYRYQLLDSSKNNTLGNSIIGGHSEVINDTLGSINIGNLPSGDYYVRLWAKDSLGNASAPVYVKFTVDHTAPVVTLQADNANPMASTSVTFSGTVTGGSDLSSLKLYSGDVEIADITNAIDSNGNWSYEFPSGFTMGDYTFRVEATDIFGNKSDELVSPQSVLALSFSQYLPGRGAGIPPMVTRHLTQALTLPGTVVAAIPAANAQNGNDQDVLGTQTEKDSAVKGAADKLAAIAPTENGWKLFGIVWYWWLLILAALSAIVWRLAAWLRREDDVLPA